MCNVFGRCHNVYSDVFILCHNTLRSSCIGISVCSEKPQWPSERRNPCIPQPDITTVYRDAMHDEYVHPRQSRFDLLRAVILSLIFGTIAPTPPLPSRCCRAELLGRWMLRFECRDEAWRSRQPRLIISRPHNRVMRGTQGTYEKIVSDRNMRELVAQD